MSLVRECADVSLLRRYEIGPIKWTRNALPLLCCTAMVNKVSSINLKVILFAIKCKFILKATMYDRITVF